MKADRRNRLVGVPKMRGFKPIIAKHEDLFDLEIESGMPIRFGYMLLWSCCDRDGIFRWRPKTLKAEIFPYDDLVMEKFLNYIWRDGYILKYENNGEVYGLVIKFTEHQSINGKELPSGYPDVENENSYVIEYIDEINALPTRDTRVTHACTSRDTRVTHALPTQVSSEFTEKEKECEKEVEFEKENEKEIESEMNKTICRAKDSTLVSDSKISLVKEVFDHWKEVMGTPRSIMDLKRKRAIEGRLSDGYQIDQLKAAIDGCTRSDYHMGINDRNAKYNDIELICRNATNVDKFIELASASKVRLTTNEQITINSLNSLFG